MTDLIYYTFHNVTVSVRAKDGKAAYTALCDLLATAERVVDFATDVYTVNDDQDPHSTTELFPDRYQIAADRLKHRGAK